MRNRRNRAAGHAAPPFIDPSFAQALSGEFSERSHRNKFDHKARQLCRQAQRALNLALGEFGDELLNRLYVADVTPAPSASHLLVHVVIPSQLSVVKVLARLDEVRPRLRMEIAAAITRKRAPELSFIAASSEVQP